MEDEVFKALCPPYLYCFIKISLGIFKPIGSIRNLRVEDP